nr:aspyridones efflux protein apdf [Quercus suber]
MRARKGDNSDLDKSLGRADKLLCSELTRHARAARVLDDKDDMISGKSLEQSRVLDASLLESSTPYPAQNPTIAMRRLWKGSARDIVHAFISHRLRAVILGRSVVRQRVSKHVQCEICVVARPNPRPPGSAAPRPKTVEIRARSTLLRQGRVWRKVYRQTYLCTRRTFTKSVSPADIDRSQGIEKSIPHDLVAAPEIAASESDNPIESDLAPTPAPDGGISAWATVAGAFLLQFCSFGFVNASSISWIVTFQLFLMFFLSQGFGVGVDIFGPRVITIPCSLLVVCGLVALSFSRQYYSIFLSQSVCFGIGAAGIFMPGLTLSSGWVRADYAMDGAHDGDPSGHRAPLDPTDRKSKSSQQSIFRITQANNDSTSWGLFGPFNFLPAFAALFQDTSYLALYTVSIINAASMFGRVLPSYLADRLGRLATMTVCSYATAISVLLIWLPVNFYPTVAGLVIFALCFGFASGAFVSLMSACLIDISGGYTSDLGACVPRHVYAGHILCRADRVTY